MTDEVETTLEIPLIVRGIPVKSRPPTRMAGEAMAVHCPGWAAHIHDLEILVTDEDGQTHNIADFVNNAVWDECAEILLDQCSE